MKFTKSYIDYVDAEVEVSETEMHRYFESALENEWNTRPSDVAWEMAAEIYNDFDDDEGHDETVEFENAWVADELARECLEYVNAHIDEFNNRPVIRDGEILLFDPKPYERY